jgi:hypothetical protein
MTTDITTQGELCGIYKIRPNNDPVFIMLYNEFTKDIFTNLMRERGFSQSYETSVILFQTELEYLVCRKDDLHSYDYYIICNKVPTQELMRTVCGKVDWKL